MKWHSTENQNVRKQWSEKNAPGLSYDTKHNPKAKKSLFKKLSDVAEKFLGLPVMTRRKPHAFDSDIMTFTP